MSEHLYTQEHAPFVCVCSCRIGHTEIFVAPRFHGDSGVNIWSTLPGQVHVHHRYLKSFYNHLFVLKGATNRDVAVRGQMVPAVTFY